MRPSFALLLVFVSLRAAASSVAVGVGPELHFPDSIPGDGPIAVKAASPQALHFVLHAPPETHFVVLLPTEIDATMRHELGTAPDLRVLVEKIDCAPSCGTLDTTGRVGADGKAAFAVGAYASTRKITLPAGTYSAALAPTIIIP